MRILALETSGQLGAVALLHSEGGPPAVLIERQSPPEQRTAQSLLPTIRQALAEAAWRPAELDAICVATGPGSFTGLRIGVVTAKTLAYASGARLAGVHTLAAIAAGLPSRPARTWAILDAQRQELFVARLDRSETDPPDPAPPATEIVGVADFIGRLAAGDLVAGPPLAKLKGLIPPGVILADEAHWRPTAASVGRLGAALLAVGRHVDPLALVPHYCRNSAAEEKAKKRHDSPPSASSR